LSEIVLDMGICIQVWVDDSPQAIVPRIVLNPWGEPLNNS